MNEPKYTLINVGDFAKTAETLVNKISDAIGGVARPWQIVRVAEAEAKAEKIQAATQIEITELQRRAMMRFFAEESKRQNNIEGITAKALPDVSPEAKPEKVEDDWIANFFDRCRLISDEEMQTLWARILSGEANSPGRFSKRIVDLLGTLDKSDAMLFIQLCGFILDVGEPCPLVYDENHGIYIKNDINFDSLSHLESIGLIQFATIGGISRSGFGQKGNLPYFGTLLWIEFPQPDNNVMQIGRVRLTRSGQQLASIVVARPVEGFPDYLREQWKLFGYKTEPSSAGANPNN